MGNNLAAHDTAQSSGSFNTTGITLGFNNSKEIYDAAGNALKAGSPSSVERFVMDNTAPAGNNVITWNTIAGDDNINMFEDDATHTTVGASVAHADARAGDAVTVTVSQTSPAFTKSFNTTLVDDGGTLKFTYNVPQSDMNQANSVTASISVTDFAGNTGTLTGSIKAFTDDNVAPDAITSFAGLLVKP